ncbi:MAG TPA: hypothetical protein VIX37_22865 [Candidatus Sulfotelmatobacter sp.]
MKARAAIDLVAAVNAVVDDRQFVSSGFSAQEFTTEAQTASSD